MYSKKIKLEIIQHEKTRVNSYIYENIDVEFWKFKSDTDNYIDIQCEIRLTWNWGHRKNFFVLNY